MEKGQESSKEAWMDEEEDEGVSGEEVRKEGDETGEKVKRKLYIGSSP